MVSSTEPALICAVGGIVIIVIEIISIVVVASHGHPGDSGILKNICACFADRPFPGGVVVYHITHMEDRLNIQCILVVCDPLHLFVIGILPGSHQLLSIGQHDH